MNMRTRLLTALAVATALVASARTVELHTASASCRVDLDGARILSFRSHGDETLWNDTPAQTNAADWAHGGVPLCWPRFGVDESGAIHGVAWRRTFAVRGVREDRSRSELALGLALGDARLEYTIVLTDALSLELATANTGTNDFACSYGFHPSLLVAERAKSSVAGVDGMSFEDDPSRARPERGVWRGTLTLEESVDRIFALPESRRGRFALEDHVRGRTVVVECAGASHLNVWNPGPEKQCPGVVPGDEWRRFVCIEPIFVGGADGRPVPVPPGGRRVLRMTIAANARVEKGIDCR